MVHASERSRSSGKTTSRLRREQHARYEQELVRRMVADVRPRWIGRLQGVDAYLADNCWAMLETFVVQGAPRFAAPSGHG